MGSSAMIYQTHLELHVATFTIGYWREWFFSHLLLIPSCPSFCRLPLSFYEPSFVILYSIPVWLTLHSYGFSFCTLFDPVLCLFFSSYYLYLFLVFCLIFLWFSSLILFTLYCLQNAHSPITYFKFHRSPVIVLFTNSLLLLLPHTIISNYILLVIIISLAFSYSHLAIICLPLLFFFVHLLSSLPPPHVCI